MEANSDLYEKIVETLQTNGIELITMGGSISPYLGAGVAAVLAILLVYLGFKIKKRNWKDEQRKAGEKIQTQTSKDQKTSKDVNDGIDGFLDRED